MQRQARALRIRRRLSRAALALGAAALLAACAGPGPRPAVPFEGAAECVELFGQVDDAVRREGVADAMATRIEGFPQLRVNRLLASFRDEVPDPPAIDFWIARLAQLDAEARAVELANLPPSARAALQSRFVAAAGGTLAASLDACRQRLNAADAADPARLAALRRAATVPDDYSTARRILGLYGLTRLPFAAGVRAFERGVESVFALPLEALPVRGTLHRVAPVAAPALSRPKAAELIGRAAANPLGIPYPDAASLERLAHAHAPVFELDVAGDDDRIGAPAWPAHGPVRIDTRAARLFYRAAHTRVGDRVLLQIVYTAWFPARPPAGAFDLLAGRLDGLVWRVSLAPDGEPLVFDSIHPCGCYHFFFPTARARPRPAPDTLDEWRFMPQRVLPRQRDDERVVLRVAARTHYLERVRYEPRPPAPDGDYALVHADTLRSLPRADGERRSLYGADGFVAGTERGERFFFWPMGVRNAGAMRQWGRHATAFVGRRHFDAPRLLDERFAVELPADEATSAPAPAREPLRRTPSRGRGTSDSATAPRTPAPAAAR